ncbi:MAG: replication-associated recombination protein A, partial [Bdellovibrionota bacterium]
MRPETLDEFVGQEKVLGPGKPLRQWILTDRVPSLILWGPPGCGKTTLGRIIAHQTKSHFVPMSAVLSGVKDIKETVERARETQRLMKRKTILFVDEIHRFNKSQQDALLPHVEDGTVTLVGATTENPSFEINSALLSRARVIRLERITTEALRKVVDRALADPEKGLGGFLKLSGEAADWLAATSEGDARRALTALESIALYAGELGAERELDLEAVKLALESAMERQPIPYDKSGEEHYNVISAFIKSLRDSDPHAGLYYLARMLEGGEDPMFIARRLVILASEDVGNADPRGLQVAIAAKEAVEFVGMPEARINLAQAVTYLAMAPKSNASYMGINE